MGISIFQWNANSLLAHIHEFKYYLDKLEYLPDIICVQETFLKPTLTVNIPGYNLLRQDGSNGRGGTAIFIKCGLNYSNFTCYNDGIEGISIQIETISGPLEVFNFYISPSYRFDESFFQNVFARDDVFICGDFNAKSTLWGSAKADIRGKSIENILRMSNVVVLNSCSPTRIHKN